MTESGDVRAAALAAHRAGLAVLPPRIDGSKRPIGDWQDYQQHRAPLDQVDRWYSNGRTGLGVVCGHVSGNLELLEFDDAGAYQALISTARQAGLGDLIARVEAGYCERTPSGGIHWLYRCEQVSGNTKLARRLKRPDERRHPGDKIQVLIETRGEGGYVITAPSTGTVHPSGRPYQLTSGGFDHITTITTQERAALFDLARSFDELPAPEPPRPVVAPLPDGDGRPGDEFNQKASWRQILEPHGWTLAFQRGTVGYWRKPGKRKPGHSATTDHGGHPYLIVFTTSTEFEPERGYSKFAAYALLNHGNDFAAASKALREQGYGTPPTPPPAGNPRPRNTNGNNSPPRRAPQPPDPVRFKLTDYGNAERLINHHGRDLRYCHPWKKWLVWNGTRWALDDTAEVTRWAKKTVRAIYAEAKDEDDDKQRARIIRHAQASEAGARVKAMLELAASEPGIPVLPDALDRDPWLLNVTNGTLDLRTGTLKPHDPDDLITKLAPVAYDPDAGAPLWGAFLARIMDDDRELIDFLQLAAGYSLTGLTSEQCLFLPYGTGANGKSVYLTTLAALLGDYAQQAPRDLLMTRQHNGIPNDVARLRGARLVNVIETTEGRRLDEELVKQLTGGDTISARFMHGEFFDFRPQCKIWLATNHRPRVRGTDHGIWRRVRLVPFEVTIPDDQQDRDLGDKLRGELPGILAWAVQGCRTWHLAGLGYPDKVKAATDEYRAEQDVLGEFISARCVLDANAHAYARDLYDAYIGFSGEKLSQRAFGLALRERGFDKAELGHAKRIAWLGLGLIATDSGDE